MKKPFLFLLFALWSYTLQAQIVAFNNAQANNFYGIGGYSYSQFTFPTGLQPTPYVVSGPSPQNDFSYVITASSGAITNSAGVITTTNSNENIYIEMKGNNVRKFAFKVFAHVNDVTNPVNNIIDVTAVTNLGNQILQTANNAGQFVGFNVTVNENEYIVSVTASFQSTPSPARRIALFSIMAGDNTPQNVALNFDGVDDYVSIPSTVGNFGTNDNFTVTCWIKPDATQPSSAINPDENDIISKWAGTGSGVNNNYPFVIRYLNETQTDPARRGKILVGQWDGTVFTTRVSTVAVNDGKWHHVAFVRSSIGFSLYIDGSLQGLAVADNVNNNTANTTPLQIGRRGNGQNYFKGEIDEVSIRNDVLNTQDIANGMFCKNSPFPFGLVAHYNFSNGVPHDNNALIAQVQDAVSTNHGTLNNFAKTGDASNFVTGQVKYVKKPAFGNFSGSSWANAFIDLQFALTATTCNDLFEVYVAKSNAAYKPDASNTAISFTIPSGMRIYGGFAGTEKSINQRNMALIHSTNKTTLSGDLNGNDTQFNFTTNRGDNSFYPVNITGNNVVFDGFTVSGSINSGAGIRTEGTNATIKNSRIIDNINNGLYIFGGNATIANCSIMGNKSSGIFNSNSTASIKECLIANNGFHGIEFFFVGGTRQTTITNSTIASNANYGINVVTHGGSSTNTLKNTLIYGNGFGGIFTTTDGFGTINNTITYSLVEGVTTGTGNLNGTTVNPQFVSPLANTVISDAGDYRLKWCSYAINAGDNVGISPLDLDRKPRNFNTTADMGAYEFLGNTPSPTNAPNSTITGIIDSPTYAGGAIQTITSTAKILAPAGAIDFKAPNSIILSPGFEARGVGKYFKAEIGANQTCSN